MINHQPQLTHRSTFRRYLIFIIVLFALVGCKDGGCKGCNGHSSQATQNVDALKEIGSRVPADVSFVMFAQRINEDTVNFFMQDSSGTLANNLAGGMGSAQVKFTQLTGINLRDPQSIKDSGIAPDSPFLFAKNGVDSPGVQIFIFRVGDMDKATKNLVPKWKGKSETEEKTLHNQKVTFVKPLQLHVKKTWFFKDGYGTLIQGIDQKSVEETTEKYVALATGDSKEKIESLVSYDKGAPFASFEKNIGAVYPINVFYRPREGEKLNLGGQFGIVKEALPNILRSSIQYVGVGSVSEKEVDKGLLYVSIDKKGRDIDLTKILLSKGSLDFKGFVTTDTVFSVRVSLDPEMMWKLWLLGLKEEGGDKKVEERLNYANSVMGVDFKKAFVDSITGEAALFFYGIHMEALIALNSKQGVSSLLDAAIVVGFKSEEQAANVLNVLVDSYNKKPDRKGAEASLVPIEGTGVTRLVWDVGPVRMYLYKNRILVTSLGMSPEDAVAYLTGKKESASLLEQQDLPYAKKFFEPSVQNGAYVNVPRALTVFGPILGLFSMQPEEFMNKARQFHEATGIVHFTENALELDMKTSKVPPNESSK